MVGLSGSGKSSVINLIPCFWEPTEGRILFDGIDYRNIKLKSLRDQIAIVTQDVFLFNDTIKANICYGLKDVSEEAIMKAVEAAALKPFIESLRRAWRRPSVKLVVCCRAVKSNAFPVHEPC